MLPIQFERVLTFFDIFGYNTGSSRLSRRKTMIIVLYFVHISMALIFSFYIFHLTFILKYLRFVELMNSLFQYSTAILTYWFIVIDSVFHRKEHRHFWAILQQIDEFIHPQNHFNLKIYLIKFIQYMFTTFISVCMIIPMHDFSDVALIVVTVVKLCQIRIFYYIFCVEVLHFQLNVIENEIQKMNKMMDFKVGVFQFRWIREYYYHVFRMTCILNKFFDWSHVAAVSFCFYLLLTELNWFCVNYRNLNSIILVGKSKFDFV